MAAMTAALNRQTPRIAENTDRPLTSMSYYPYAPPPPGGGGYYHPPPPPPGAGQYAHPPPPPPGPYGHLPPPPPQQAAGYPSYPYPQQQQQQAPPPPPPSHAASYASYPSYPAHPAAAQAGPSAPAPAGGHPTYSTQPAAPAPPVSTYPYPGPPVPSTHTQPDTYSGGGGAPLSPPLSPPAAPPLQSPPTTRALPQLPPQPPAQPHAQLPISPPPSNPATSPPALPTGRPLPSPNDDLSARLGGLSLSAPAPAPAPPAPAPRSTPGTIPPMARDVPGPTQLAWHLLWPSVLPMTFYRHPGYPKLAMCTACHASHGGSLRSVFESYDAPPGTECIFDTPRAKALLSAGDRPALEAFLAKRARLYCNGAGGSPAGTRYFHPPNADDMMACAACYEDFVLASPSTANWEQTTATTEWVCDLVPLSIRSAWSQLPPAGIVALMRDRAQMPGCQGEQVSGSTHNWYTTRQLVDGLVVCDGCYLDLVAFSPYDAEFVPVGPHDWEEAACDMHKLVDLWLWTLVDGNVGRFIHFARMALAAPQCTGAGGKNDGSWVQLPGLDFTVCPACAASYVEPLGLQPFFTRAAPSMSEWNCDLCPVTPMGMTMRAALAESVNMGKWRIDTLARAVEGMPRCPHHERSDGPWFGFSELRICTACWVTFGSHTSLAARAPLRNAQITSICALWSPRMRALWLRTCAGDMPLPQLLGISLERTQVYAETILVNGQIVQEAEKERQMAKMQAQFGLNKIAMGNMSAGVSNDSWSAPGVIGTYSDPIGIAGDRQFHAAQAALRQLPMKNARRALQIRQNTERWNMVE